jgi:hypothetical protein
LASVPIPEGVSTILIAHVPFVRTLSLEFHEKVKEKREVIQQKKEEK